MLHRFGPFELDERRFELRRRGKPVAVQRQVLETIAYLVKNPDRLISKDELIKGPWKGTAVSDAALAHVIMVARRALTDRNKGKPIIETVRGKGYRFVAEVTTSTTPASARDSRLEMQLPASSNPSKSGSTSDRPFLGREKELKTLATAAAKATAGHGSLVLIGGEPGIGKTSLLERFGKAAHEMDVLWGRCWEARGPPRSRRGTLRIGWREATSPACPDRWSR